MRWRLDVRRWFHGFVVFPNEVYHRTFDEGRAVERELLRGVLSNAVYSRAMDQNLTVYTVESHRSNLMEKLNLRGLPEVILYAVRNGIISQACTGFAAIQVV